MFEAKRKNSHLNPANRIFRVKTHVSDTIRGRVHTMRSRDGVRQPVGGQGRGPLRVPAHLGLCRAAPRVWRRNGVAVGSPAWWCGTLRARLRFRSLRALNPAVPQPSSLIAGPRVGPGAVTVSGCRTGRGDRPAAIAHPSERITMQGTLSGLGGGALPGRSWAVAAPAGPRGGGADRFRRPENRPATRGCPPRRMPFSVRIRPRSLGRACPYRRRRYVRSGGRGVVVVGRGTGGAGPVPGPVSRTTGGGAAVGPMRRPSHGRRRQVDGRGSRRVQSPATLALADSS